jgi:tetratricopeptide (TPR) repeat protein
MATPCTVERFGEDFVLVKGGGPVRTPLGTPLVSRYEELVCEAAKDVAAMGADPTEQFSMYSLQASYLDFTLRRPRPQLEEGLVHGASSDLWFNRPAFPPMDMALAQLWGPARRESVRELPRGLQMLSLRELTAAIVARANLNSAQLALEVLASAGDIVPLAKGACASHFDALIARHAPGPAINLRDESAWRRPPVNSDPATCNACMSGDPGQLHDPSRCELHGHLLLLRRFAKFPEEPLQRSLELLEFFGRSARESGGKARVSAHRAHGRCECELHFDRGTEKAKAGDLEGAIAEYAAATELCCDNAQAWLYLGNCHFNIGNHDEALDALERAITLQPDSALIWESKANVLNDLDRDEEAFDCYVRALEFDPTRVRSRNELARVMIDQRRFADAVELADGALKVDPEHWYANALRALALQEMGRSEEAEVGYRRSIAANPRSAQTLNNYGTLVEARGDREGAIALYERAVQANPRYELAVRNLRRLAGDRPEQ